MANNPELDKLDMDNTKTSIELETVQLEESTLESIKELNGKLNNIVNAFGQMYLRRKELHEELEKIEEGFEKAEQDFKSTNAELKEILNDLEREYPRGQVDLQNGTVTYQPSLKTLQSIEQNLEQE
jgi:DNA repair ATPase RecN